MTAAAAKFPPNPRRRSMLAKVHLAKKELGLIDDDYRAVLFDVAGRTSAADCTDRELEAVLERFKARGFSPTVKAGARPPRPRPADHPVARKAQAMWISLYHLCAVDNPSDQALEAFARRQLGVEKLQWADQSQGYKLIEALKAMAVRAGWQQDDLPRADPIRVLKRRLCEQLLSRLQRVVIAPRTWTLDVAAFRLLGMQRRDSMPWDLGDLDVIAEGFGRKLREFRG